MKNLWLLFTIVILIVSACSSSKSVPANTGDKQGPTIISISAEGNLESFEPIGCVSLSEVRTVNTPADLIPASKLCIDESKYDKAATLYLAARAYAYYDMKRVSDISAHQAIFMLEEGTFQSLNGKQVEDFQKAFDPITQKDSKESIEFCSDLNNLGPPTYHPVYMIQHGLGAFTNTQGDGLVEDFDSLETWSQILMTMECV